MSPVRQVIHYPDPRLKQSCRSVAELRQAGIMADADVVSLAADLLDTMDSFPGCVGIAAPQVGELVRMVAIDATGHRKARSCHGRLVLVDPVLTAEHDSCVLREGCLSIPDFTGNVRRAERIAVSATGVDGAPLTLECDAFEARLVLHELDHLDGYLFLDRVASARDAFPRTDYR